MVTACILVLCSGQREGNVISSAAAHIVKCDVYLVEVFVGQSSKLCECTLPHLI